MRSIKILLAALLLLTAANVAYARAKLSSQPLQAQKEQIAERLEKLVPRLLDEGLVPGLSLALVQKGELVWQRGFGVSNAQTGQAVTERTVFEAASLSKPVFAYAVLRLADSGKLDLDTPLNKYMPGRYDVQDDERIGQITARHVLSHTPGFPNWRRPGGPLSIHFTPGERFSYSGEGFVYLARVVEHITGQPFNELVKRMVFIPLGMTDSSFVWRDEYDRQKTFRHNLIGEPAGQNKVSEANAAASLQTTAADYARFMAGLMKGTGLRRETLGEMFEPQIRVSQSGTNNTARAPEKLSTELAWGLGWGLQTTGDGLSIWHWGDNGNTKAYVVAYPRQQSGVVVFTNSANGLSIMPEIIGAAVGGEHPALAWLNYESYRSPAKTLFRNILKNGAARALGEYQKARASGDVLSERQMNRLGYDLMAVRRLSDAIEVFRLNVADYPQSANVYDSLAEAYMVNGDRELAITNYRRSVELDAQNKNAIEMLKKLNAEPQ